jgi:hypothetical protein
VATYAELPPVLMPDADDPARLRFGWGDLRIDASFDAAAAPDFELAAGRVIDVDGYVSALIGGTVVGGAEGSGFGFEVAGAPEVRVQIESFADSRQRTAVGRLFEDYLRAVLVDFLDQAVGAVPIPELDLTAIAPNAPDTRLALRVASIERRGRYHLLLGDLE